MGSVKGQNTYNGTVTIAHDVQDNARTLPSHKNEGQHDSESGHLQMGSSAHLVYG